MQNNYFRCLVLSAEVLVTKGEDSKEKHIHKRRRCSRWLFRGLQNNCPIGCAKSGMGNSIRSWLSQWVNETKKRRELEWKKTTSSLPKKMWKKPKKKKTAVGNAMSDESSVDGSMVGILHWIPAHKCQMPKTGQQQQLIAATTTIASWPKTSRGISRACASLPELNWRIGELERQLGATIWKVVF